MPTLKRRQEEEIPRILLHQSLQKRRISKNVSSCFKSTTLCFKRKKSTQDKHWLILKANGPIFQKKSLTLPKNCSSQLSQWGSNRLSTRLVWCPSGIRWLAMKPSLITIRMSLRRSMASQWIRRLSYRMSYNNNNFKEMLQISNS